MKSALILSLALAMALPAVSQEKAVLEGDLDNPAILETFVDAIATTHMKEENSPSGVVSIVKDGQLIFAKGYGYQDVDGRIPVDPARTLFRPGSISKLFTWTAVMQQVEQGRLNLDADVNDYLERFQIRDAWPGQPVTLQHIMTHSPGFEDGGLGYLIIRDPSRLMPLHESLARYQPMRVNPPGVQTAYSNYGAALAGLIVSNVSGQDFNEYVEEHIFGPLGMNNSSFREPLPKPLAENMATAYTYDNGVYRAEDFELVANFGPAGSLSATATDMARFMLAFLGGGELEGGRILQPETVEQMWTRQFTHDERLSGMGLGFYENELNGVRWLGHGGDTFYFHSNLGIDPVRRVGYFVSFGAAGGADVRTTFAEAFADRFYESAEYETEPREDFADRAGEYGGTYLFWRGSFSTLEKVGDLLAGISVSPTDKGTLVIGDRQYVEVEADLFEVVGEPGVTASRIAFQRDAQGDVSGFVMENGPFMSTYKAPTYRTLSFNGPLLALSMVVFVAVLLRRFYQRKTYKQLPPAEKRAGRAAVVTSVLNLLFVVSFVVFVVSYGQSLYSEIPASILVVLAFPILASTAALYQLYQTAVLWRGRHCSFWQRLRYTGVTLLGLFMVWFYSFWNLLGFQYM